MSLKKSIAKAFERIGVLYSRESTEIKFENLDKEKSIIFLDNLCSAFIGKNLSRIKSYLSDDIRVEINNPHQNTKSKYVLNKTSYVTIVKTTFEITNRFDEYRYDVLSYKSHSRDKAELELLFYEKTTDVLGIEKYREIPETVVITMIDGLPYLNAVIVN
jgi:hypothetical protein